MSASHSQCAIVKIMHDVLIAYSKVGMLDRDFSPRNILFVPHGNGDVHGILINWDQCRRVETLDTEGARRRGRTGTWQFLSYQLLINPYKAHTLQDDLQSSFWTLLYTALKFIPSSLSGMRLANMLKTVFDESRWDDDQGSYVGENEKLKIIMHGNYIKPNSIAGTPPIIFRDPATPLNDLVQSLLFLFQDWDTYHIMALRETRRLDAKAEAEKLLTSEAIIQLFKEAYTSPDWSHEIADRQEGLVSEEGRPGGSSSKRVVTEGSEQRRNTQRKSRTSDATSARLEILDQ
ncbi:hypothetical protein OE88DRAFT_1812603 [Heliocybe sulcata]|uniref:Fungal-type protein kinase domain-containing protein n=1 Tax=Heliocybe sulcata TaxID=5364 RepID=A0A5C3ML23_9AGAM|nr:hypothetical protein OE88DRAFT_1812603 [Heliocybe sulcata]